MADKLHGTAKAGTTSLSLDIALLKSADGLPQTAKLAADLTVAYHRQGAAVVQVTPISDLALITTAWTAKGVKEVDATLEPGIYRVDFPDAAFATGADYVTICVQCTGCFPYVERVALESVGSAEVYARQGAPAGASQSADVAAVKADTSATLAAVDTEEGAIKAKTDNLPPAPAAVGSAMTLTTGERDAIADAILARPRPTAPTTAGTVGEAIEAAWSQGYGKWAVVGNTLTLYAANGTTVLRAFDLTPHGGAFNARTPI